MSFGRWTRCCRAIARGRMASRIKHRLAIARIFPGRSKGAGAMQRLLPRDPARYERLMRRLDQAAEQINPFLVVIAIGLLILDASCLVSLLDTGILAAHQGGAAAPAASAVGAMPN